MLGTKRKDNFEPYWQDEKDWLCIVEFLPTDDPEARLFAADIIGYLVDYANLTNTRSLPLVGDPDASAYELLFSFSSPEEKNEFLNLVRSNDDMGKDYITELTPPLLKRLGMLVHSQRSYPRMPSPMPRRSTPARRPIVFLECQAGIDEAKEFHRHKSCDVRNLCPIESITDAA